MYTFHLRKDPISVPTDVTIVAETAGNAIIFAAARRGENDTFNRKLGRRIAEGRLRKYIQSGMKTPRPGIFVIESDDFSSESFHEKARTIGIKVANDRNFSGKVYRGKKR